ncbi:MAG: Hsp20/alpha crystallin family protein [Alphaproteobacteria bacterium]|nr:Hsp20/alpha crystallin family protein [Alphaproteobacteria bacterium]
MSVRELIHWNRPFGISIRRKDDAFNSLASLQDEMNDFFERLYSGLNARLTDWNGSKATVPAVDIKENEKSFTVKAELAGIDPKNVEVETTGGFLTIRGQRSGEKEEKKEEKDYSYLRREISEGYFQRALALPETADCEKAEASFKNGILTVSVPKKPEAIQKPRKLQIKKAA